MLAKYNCTVHSCGFISKAPGSHSIFWTTLSLLSSNKALCNLIWSLRVMSMIFINCAMQPCGSIFKASGSHFIAYYESISKSLCICMSYILVLYLKKSFASTIFSVSLMLPNGLYRLSQICNNFLEHEFEPPPFPLCKMSKKNAILVRAGFPHCRPFRKLYRACFPSC